MTTQNNYDVNCKNDSIQEHLLKLLLDSNINMDTFLSQANVMKRNKTYLDMHTYKIWKGENGYWFTYLPDKTKKDNRKLTKAITEERLQDKIIAYYQSKDSVPTFQKIFDLWIDAKLHTDITKHTVDKYKSDFKRFFNDSILKEMKIDVITESLLKEEITRIIVKQQLTRKAYTGLRTVVMGPLHYAYERKYTSISTKMFFAEIGLSKRIFQISKKPEHSQVYDDNDRIKLMDYLAKVNDKYKPLALGILFDFRSGLRIGELMALKKDDLVDGVLLVRRQHITYESDIPGKRVHLDVDYTKSDAGTRDVIITPKGVAVFNEMCRLNPDGEFVFMINNRRAYDIDYNKYLRRVCKELGIGYKSMHKIRKTYATILMNSGMDDIYITRTMGHNDIDTTRKYYYQCSKDMDEYRKQINNAINF